MRGAWIVVALAGCEAASPDPGYGALLQVSGAQFRPGGFPAATGGPAALSVTTTHATVTIAVVREQLHGLFGGDARAAIVGIDGADGAWIVPAGPPDIDTPGDATVTALFGLARDATPGAFTLVIAATDADGRIGAPATVALVADAAPLPDGDLVVHLEWSGAADLDLHVVDPLQGEAWSGHPDTWQAPPPGEPVDPNAYLTGGLLDHDANADCHRDGGTPFEDVIWKSRTGSNGPVAPIIPPGEYVVRVATRAMCGDASAAWYVAVTRAGVVIAAARGVSTEDDVAIPPATAGAGAGITAIRVTP